MDLHLKREAAIEEARHWRRGIAQAAGTAIYHAPIADRRIFLTFDDGPCRETTPAILDLLERFDAKAMFFVVGRYARDRPGLIERIARAGHGIGCHTQNHVDLSRLNAEAIRREIEECCRSIKESGGGDVSSVRPPWGRFGWRALLEARRARLRLTLWTFDSLDWRLTDPDAIVERLRAASIAPGDILLFHDDYRHTVEALPGVLETLGGEGWTCASLANYLAKSVPMEDGTHVYAQ